jgi:hypothetical protein
MEGRLSVLIDECGVSDDEQLGALIVRTPSLLHTPLGQIRSRAEWLVSSGVVESGSRPKERSTNIGAFLLRQPDYFSVPTAKCKDVFRWLLSIGLTKRKAAGVISSEPSVLNQPIDQLSLRSQFFLSVLGGTLPELCNVPHMLTCDLAKVPMLRHAYCLSNGLEVKPTELLVKGDATFVQIIERDLEELNAFEQEGKHLSFFQGSAM